MKKVVLNANIMGLSFCPSFGGNVPVTCIAGFNHRTSNEELCFKYTLSSQQGNETRIAGYQIPPLKGAGVSISS